MEFNIKSINSEKQHTNCLVIGLFDAKKLSMQLEQLDKISNGHISSLLKQNEISAKLGKVTVLHAVPNIPAKKVMLIGCGKERDFDEKSYNTAIAKALSALKENNVTEAAILLTELPVKQLTSYWKVRRFIELSYNQTYCFDQFKTNTKQPEFTFKKLTLSAQSSESKEAKLGLAHGQAIATAINVTKDVSNMPPNICNAAYLADQGKQLATQYKGVKTTALGEKKLKELGMNAYLAVGNGSKNESIMTVMEYSGAADKKAQPIVLVGKGLTFDSGGISIKPAGSMDEMKYDMCGAATVLGVMHAIAQLQLPINVVGVMAGCENMPDSEAYRPGDILTTMSGQTIEVLNTDAEGRLVLCDALTYVERFKPQYVVDIATLTGACIIALGHHYTGLMANNEKLATGLLDASTQASDRAWRLPMDSDFQQQIDSTIADIANTGGREGGAITAGCFLARFTEKYQWAHLDIAGTAWVSGAKKGATGRPVAMLVQFLLNQAGVSAK